LTTYNVLKKTDVRLPANQKWKGSGDNKCKTQPEKKHQRAGQIAAGKGVGKDEISLARKKQSWETRGDRKRQFAIKKSLLKKTMKEEMK